MESKLDDNIDLLRVGMWFHCRSEKEKCTSMFYSIPALKTHFMEKHPDEELKLPENLTQEELDGKVILVEKPTLRSYIVNCRWCFKSFKTQSQLNFHNKKNPKCYLQPAQDQCSYETRRKSATSKETSPETSGIAFKNTQKRRKLQNIRKIKKKRSRGPKRPTQNTRLIFSNRFRCATCKKSFSTPYQLTRHSATHSGKLPFKCTCGSCFKTLDGFSKHIKGAYQQDQTNHQLVRQLTTKTGGRSFNCTTCGASFKWNSSLTRHITTVHGVNNLHSSETVKNSFSNGELAQQKEIEISKIEQKLEEKHHPDLQQPHTKSLSSSPILEKRSSTPKISDSRRFRCGTCQKYFSTRYDLTRHSATHSLKRPFKCTCGSCFRSQDGFSKHIKEAYQLDQGNHKLIRQLTSKKGKRSFNCTTCGASFNWNSNLTRHVAAVHGVDKSNGSETGNETSLSGELTPPTVMKISNSEQKLEGKFQPDVQEPQSKSSSLSFPGKRSSTPKISDSRHFRCATCPKSFLTRYDLTRHSATHSGKLPFKCTCGSGFITKDSFSKHIKEAYKQDNSIHQLDRKLMTQTGELAFVCTTCGASFNRNFSLTRHVATVHYAEKKVETQEGMGNLALDGSAQGKTGSAPEEKKVPITNIKVELNGMKGYYYNCHECPYQGKDPHRFQSHRQLHEDGSNIVICSVCGWFLLPSLLTLHQNLHHPQTEIKY